jgi:hypothetical protein
VAGSAKVDGLLTVSNSTGIPATTASLLRFASGFTTPDIGRMYIGDGTGWKFHMSKRVSSTTTDLITFQDNGNVGIGNNDPIYKLDVNGGTLPYLLNLESTWNTTAVAYGINLNVTNTASDPSSYLLRLAISNNDYFSVKTDGKVYMVLPTSSSGLSSGQLWNDGGTVKIV